MRKSIQLAYDEWFDLNCSFAAKAGFKEVSVILADILDKTEEEWDREIDKIGEVLNKHGLWCSQSHPFFYDLRVSSEKTDERYEFSMRQAVRASAKLGAEWCVFHPRTSITSGFSVKQAFEDNRRSISTYLEVAKKYGTGIAIENLSIFSEFVPMILTYSCVTENLIELCDSFKDKSVGICWDTGHANLMPYDQADRIRMVGERIKCTHIHNNFGIRDTHLTPDQGNIPWEKVMHAFKEVGYNGALTLETHCRYNEPKLLENFTRYNYECLEFLDRLYK
ncbi:MAG: sugar phosphate isomerase/epimerase [Clostridia bacterium]|nr:sugar phosphate isomerase/epimerase [Clostridia bacterium]